MDDRGLAVPRISAGSEGGEEVPVGFAGVEERSDSEVGEVGHRERGPLDSFDQIVDSLGGTLGDVRLVPRGDLVLPA